MPTRKDLMDTIISAMEDGKEYTHPGLLILIQQLTGFRRETCIAYIEDMKRMGLIVRGRNSQVLCKKEGGENNEV